jgi:hypothetical protein
MKIIYEQNLSVRMTVGWSVVYSDRPTKSKPRPETRLRRSKPTNRRAPPSPAGLLSEVNPQIEIPPGEQVSLPL